MKNLEINIPAKDHSYDINFIQDFISLKKEIARILQKRRYIIVTDENVFSKSDFFTKKSEFFDINTDNTLVLKPGESSKNWASIDQILNFAFDQDLDRNSVMIAIGGGVVGDMTGFASSVYMRGIKCIQVPTTLLSMVDSSVGGKTGIDCEYGKNLIGSFAHPEAVLASREFLNSLPQEEIKNGLGEMIKHGIINSPQHFENLKNLNTDNWDPTTKNSIQDLLFELVPDSIQIKKEVVEQDEKEAGIRGFLNLGHTFGHAIEHLTKYQVSHGRAVAIGCMMAAEYALEQKLCDEDLLDELEHIFNHFEIDLTCDLDEDEIWKAMRFDKKKQDGSIRLVLPKKIGEVEYFTVKS